MSHFIMHSTTKEYIYDRVIFGLAPNHRINISSEQEFKIYGHKVVIDNLLVPTVDETDRWIFPKERFVIYEESDEDWCRYFGIGRQGLGVIIGEIYRVVGDGTRYPIEFEFSNPSI